VQSLWEGFAQHTRCALAQGLRWYLRSLAAAGYPDQAQAVVRPRTPKPRNVTPSPTELEKARATPNLPLRWMVLCASEAALRSATALAVKVRECQHGMIVTGTKGGQYTAVPISERLRVCLAALPPGTPPDSEARVVDLLNGQPIRKAGTMSDRWCAWKRSQGIRAGLRLHDLRRGLARSLYETTKDARQVKVLLSHAKLSSTLWYLDATDQKLDASGVLRAIEAQEQKP
jgi:integrase